MIEKIHGFENDGGGPCFLGKVLLDHSEIEGGRKTEGERNFSFPAGDLDSEVIDLEFAPGKRTTYEMSEMERKNEGDTVVNECVLSGFQQKLHLHGLHQLPSKFCWNPHAGGKSLDNNINRILVDFRIGNITQTKVIADESTFFASGSHIRTHDERLGINKMAYSQKGGIITVNLASAMVCVRKQLVFGEG
jgi:hypothetical protein